jgi:DNA-3-methyladenine glycosylase I
VRCFGDGDPVYEAYHDDEWGRPQLSEQQLFEKVCLEGFQAGLAWITVLRKRTALREALAGFDPDRLVDVDVAPLLADTRLIRSGPKLRACVRNAEATIALRSDGGLPALVREHADLSSPAPQRWGEVPASTPSSADLAKRLKKAGYVFVGPTTVYSLLQACGLVGDHLLSCDARERAEAERAAALA